MALGCLAIHTAQGSATVAMITAVGVLTAFNSREALGCDPIYLALAIGSGSLIGSWMNDSGFWIFAKMSVLTESEGLKSWSILLAFLASVWATVWNEGEVYFDSVSM